MLFVAKLLVLVEADSRAEAEDAISETMRDVSRDFDAGSPIVTWEYAFKKGATEGEVYPVKEDLATLSEAEVAVGNNPTYDISISELTPAKA